MIKHSPSILLIALCAVAMATLLFACNSQPEQPAPPGYAQQPMQPGYPPQPAQGYPQQPAHPGQVAPPVHPGQVAPPVHPGQVAPPVHPGQVAPPAQQMQPVQTAPGQPVQPVQPVQPMQPGQNPLGGLLGAMGQAAGQQPAGGAVTHIPWQSLSQALPVSAPGWAMEGQVKGESANVMGISVSQASCRLKQGNLSAKVEIIDTSMNPMIAMPFNMARSVQIDSSEERMGPINFGTYPGTQRFEKRKNKAEVLVMVHNRVMVKVEVKNAASEAQAVELARYINFAHLVKLAGG